LAANIFGRNAGKAVVERGYLGMNTVWSDSAVFYDTVDTVYK